ncbi:restriction endonuclease subunit S [uncultured Rothia sp.]|uniref:restriction endonuclease subunit S n=1 Tax=uncultured Rothia sp. TaxID=316088 RepID=UPI003216ABCA
MYGNPFTNPKNLSMKRLGEIATIVTGNSPPRSDKSNFGSHLEWIKSNNLGGKIATEAEEWLSETGGKKARVAPACSILVTCIAGSPESIGKCSLTDRDVAFKQQINAILPNDKNVSEFILNQLKIFPELVRQKSTDGMKGLVNKSSFENIHILFPTDIMPSTADFNNFEKVPAS